MAGLGLVGAGGVAGAQDALQQLLAQRIAAEKQAALEQQQQQELAMRGRGLDLQARGYDLEEARMNQPAPPDKPMSMGPGQSLVDPASGRIITQIPAAPEKPQGPMTLSPGAQLVDPSTGRIIIRNPTAQTSGGEPLVPVMGDDGQSVLMPRSQAAGRRPASVREQGRPVVSGDANRIADLDTSLDDVDVLEQEIGTTGASSKLGAMVPNFVSELTGFGEDAKQRQGTIDRVKQVIGKALEGGVLRKEDEYKYEKILPTIGDPPEVAKTKIAGLRAALIKRRQTLLDALGDAGYETGNFSQRSGDAGTPSPADLIKKYGGY